MSMSLKESYEGDAGDKSTRTKIVVHINNYLVDSEDENTGHDLTGQLRSLASPDSFFLDNGSHYSAQYNCDVDLSRLKR